jgi:hypothetical protein
LLFEHSIVGRLIGLITPTSRICSDRFPPDRATVPHSLRRPASRCSRRHAAAPPAFATYRLLLFLKSTHLLYSLTPPSSHRPHLRGTLRCSALSPVPAGGRLALRWRGLGRRRGRRILRRSRNAKKREALHAVQWGMELGSAAAAPLSFCRHSPGLPPPRPRASTGDAILCSHQRRPSSGGSGGGNYA